MAKKEKKEEVAVEETVVEEKEINKPHEVGKDQPIPEGGVIHTKASFQELMDKYKEQNPAKYELKKDALAKTLKSLK